MKEKLLGHCKDHGCVGNADGYLATNRKINGKLISCYGHRLAYCQAHGMELKDIKGLVIRHKCDNPRCINPDHLETGTVADNNRDCLERGRYVKSNVKINREIVGKIRKEYSPRKVTQKQLGEKYGICRQQVGSIVRNEKWKRL